MRFPVFSHTQFMSGKHSQHTRAAESTSSNVDENPRPTKKSKHIPSFPWSKSYDLNVCAVWDAAKGQPATISKILDELGVRPCPSYNQVRARITTQEFKETKEEFDEGVQILSCSLIYIFSL